MKRSVLSAAAVVTIATSLAGCSTRSGPAAAPAPISHLVFFDLTDPADAAALVADCRALLPSIPGVVACAAGAPFDTNRDTVDAAYDVGLYVGFVDADAYDVYIDHPQHVELVEKWRARFEAVLVRDFLDDRP